MTKKKYSRPKHQKDVSLEDTSEEEFNIAHIAGKSCLHVSRGIHFGRVKKSVKSAQSIITCNGCSNEDVNEELPEVWLCLQCGYRGCGRMSENKHGLQHFKTLHSDCHSLVLSTTSGSVWCYDCDDEISLQASQSLKQCVEFVMKMVPDNTNTSNTSSVNKSVSQKSLQNSVIKEETSVQNVEEASPVEQVNKSVKCKETSVQDIKENGPVEKVNKPVKYKENSQKTSIKGLRNLGNTCFFNAVMQNLNQTPLLYHELKNTCTPSYLWQVPELSITNNGISESDSADIVKLSLPRQLTLTNNLLNFFDQMCAISTSKVDVVNPSQLFGEISKKCPQFRHFQQQDSHELLRQLLDGIRQEEIKRQKKAILRYFDLENVCPENVDDEMKKQIKAYGCYASHTIVEKVFGGLLISTVLCEECKASSQVFEPFMDLSLPLFEEKQQESSEQLCGMLDGGKQDHIKPLRNKKVDWESDNAEYALSKQKSDLGKPSKHQEKKQKQLAKKEKKRLKCGTRNRKNSQNEHCDNPNSDHLSETKFDNEEENSKDCEEPGDNDNQVEEDTWEVQQLFNTDEENSKDDPQSVIQLTDTYIPAAIENSNNLDVAATSDIGESQVGIDDKSSCLQASEAMDVEQTSDMQDEVKHEGNEVIVEKENQSPEIESEIAKGLLFIINQESDKGIMEQNMKTGEFDEKQIEEYEDVETEKVKNPNNIEDDVTERTNISTDIEDVATKRTKSPNASEDPVERDSIDVHCSNDVEGVAVERAKNLNIVDVAIERVMEPNDVEDVAIERVVEPNDVEDASIKRVTNPNDVENISAERVTDPNDVDDITIERVKIPINVGEIQEIVENETEKSEVTDHVSDLDKPVCNLANDLNDCLKIDSDQSNMDDRIQALSMQIRDVRIRRDSDRQENLLNSSESADDWESQKTNCTSPKSSIEDSCSIDNGDNWAHSASEQQTKDWISKTLTTLKPRYHVSPLECSINSCLSHFTKPELLTGNNKFRCENCTQIKIKKTGNKKDVVYSNASKQMLIFSPPAILTLHLKRFQQVGMSLRKVNRFVEFPLILDLSPYCCSASSILPHMPSVDDEILYSLYGIVEHSGRLTSGHYTAYVKANKKTVNRTFECQLPLAQCDLEQLLQKFSGANKESSQSCSENVKEDSYWYYISDSHVKEVSEVQVLKCQAYLLFYERIK